MKRTVTVTAHDHELTVRVKATIESRNALTRDEVRKQARALVREIASGLSAIPYSDFGVENIRVQWPK